MLPVNSGSHSACQDFVFENLRTMSAFFMTSMVVSEILMTIIFPLISSLLRQKLRNSKPKLILLRKSKWNNYFQNIIDQPYGSLFTLHQNEFLNRSVSKGLKIFYFNNQLLLKNT